MTSTDNKAKPHRFKKLRKRQKKFLDNTSDAADPQFENPTEEQQEAIDKLDRQTGFNPSPEVPLVEAASEAIMEAFTFMTIQETGEVWYYDKGVYVPGGEILVAKEAEAMFGYKLTKGKLSEIIAHIMRRTYHKHEEIDADINIINLKNGLYDIDNDKLKKHSPKHLSINQKPITYVKGAKPHRF
jgi:hypothetical protein